MNLGGPSLHPGAQLRKSCQDDPGHNEDLMRSCKDWYCVGFFRQEFFPSSWSIKACVLRNRFRLRTRDQMCIISFGTVFLRDCDEDFLARRITIEERKVDVDGVGEKERQFVSGGLSYSQSLLYCKTSNLCPIRCVTRARWTEISEDIDLDEIVERIHGCHPDSAVRLSAFISLAVIGFSLKHARHHVQLWPTHLVLGPIGPSRRADVQTLGEENHYLLRALYTNWQGFDLVGAKAGRPYGDREEIRLHDGRGLASSAQIMLSLPHCYHSTGCSTYLEPTEEIKNWAHIIVIHPNLERSPATCADS